jgi:hypothetical protein
LDHFVASGTASLLAADSDIGACFHIITCRRFFFVPRHETSPYTLDRLPYPVVCNRHPEEKVRYLGRPQKRHQHRQKHKSRQRQRSPILSARKPKNLIGWIKRHPTGFAAKPGTPEDHRTTGTMNPPLLPPLVLHGHLATWAIDRPFSVNFIRPLL